MAGSQNRIRRLFGRKPGSGNEDAGRTTGLEITIASLLGIAAILTAFAAYKTDLADGDTLKAFQEGNAQYDDGNQQFNEGNAQYANDVNVFGQYAIASQEGEKTANYILNNLMDDPLYDATQAWLDSGKKDPSALDSDAYVVAAYDKADKLVEAGDEQYEIAYAKDKEGDSYTLATVILALSLFFGGVAGVTRSHSISLAMTAFAAISILGATIYMTTI